MKASSITSYALKELLEQAGEVIKSKFTKLESFGYFLEEYVIKGAEFLPSPSNQKEFTISESTISFEDAIWTVKPLTTELKFPNSTYFIDFSIMNGFNVDLVHPGERYLPLWEVTTDEEGNISSVVDKRGDMNYVRFKLEVLGLNPEIIQACIDATNRANQTKGAGEYDNTKTYYPNNVVTYDGSSFMALVEVQGVIPSSDATKWQLMARRGVDGAGSVVSVNNISPDLDGNVELDASDVGAESFLNKGVPDGYASLDSTGNVPLSQLGNVEGMEQHGNEWHTEEFETAQGAQAKVDALAGQNNTKTVKQLDDDLIAHKAETVTQHRLIKSISKMQLGESVKIVCYGDSITFGYKAEEPDKGSQVSGNYPSVLQERLRSLYENEDITVVNSGVSSRTSRDAVANLKNLVLDHEPDLVILMFGINDTKLDKDISPEEYQNNINEVLKTLRINDIDVLVLSPTPIVNTTDDRHKRLLLYTEAAKEVSENFNYAFLDMYKEINTMFGKQLEAPGFLLPDNIHFADDKYKLIADVIIQKALYWQKDLLIVDDFLSIPAVGSPYIITNNTSVYSNDRNPARRNYRLQASADPATYVRFPFVFTGRGMDLVHMGPKTSSGGIIKVLINGIEVGVINNYLSSGYAWRTKTTLLKNIKPGYYEVELRSSDVSPAFPGQTGVQGFVGEFVFMPTQRDDMGKYFISSADPNALDVNYFKSVIDGRLRLHNQINSNNAGVVFTNSDYVEVGMEDTLAIEVEGIFKPGFGITFLGNLAGDNSLCAGYMIYFNHSNGSPILYTFTGSPGYTSLYDSNYTGIDFDESHVYRIEYDIDAKKITLLVDGVNRLEYTMDRLYHVSGWFGVYAYRQGPIDISRYEYLIK